MKYIVIGNTAEWCEASWHEEINSNCDLLFYNSITPLSGAAARLCEIHFSQKLNKRVNFPGKFIWYRMLAKGFGIDTDSKNNYVLIVYDWSRISRDFGFFNYLRRSIKNIKIVYLFTNIVSMSGASFYGITERLKDHFDIVFAFDRQDSERYGFEYFPLIYTGVRPEKKENINNDLFYVGQAKDRYEQLISIYEHAKAEGLSCDFNIVGVPPDKQKYSDEIHYNRMLPYLEVVRRIKSSRCIVDAIQHNSSGMTIKVCEAVLYNKKLITTNRTIINEHFYSENRIKLEGDDSCSLKQFLYGEASEYGAEDQYVFSPKRLYEEIKQYQ